MYFYAVPSQGKFSGYFVANCELNNRQNEIPIKNEQEIDEVTPTHKNINRKEYYN